MHGSNKSVYLSGEVQDADRDTLYEFGKEMWHEDGYDSEGYWSESDRDMKASLSFTELGTYYVQFNSEYGVEGNRINDVYALGTPYMIVMGKKFEVGKYELENSKTGEKQVFTIDELIKSCQ